MSDDHGADDIRLEPEIAKAKLAETGNVAESVQKRGVEGLARCDDPPSGAEDRASAVLARRQDAVHPALKEAFEREGAKLADHTEEMVRSVGRLVGSDEESADDMARAAKELEL